MIEIICPQLVSQKLKDGRICYFYINTVAEREARFRYQVEHKYTVKKDNLICNCPICTGEVSY